jgi:hypothetical protein
MPNIAQFGGIAKGNSRLKIPPVLLDTLEHINHAATTKDFSVSKTSNKVLLKKAKNRYFTQELCRHLASLNSPLTKAYKTTLFECCTTIVQEGQKLTSKYCGYRWCNVCNRIRTAKLLNGYLKPLNEMKQPSFVTLTIPNVNKADLRHTIVGMINVSKNIIRALKRLKIACNGIRKIECTYNVDTDTYHPHLHLIVDGINVGNEIINEWLKRYPFAERSAQLCKLVTNDEKGLKELFKYTTKIVSKAKTDYQIFIPALDSIFKSIKGMRTFQTFGNIKKLNDEVDELLAEQYDNIEFYDFVVWKWERNDWVNMVDGKLLTKYKPSKAMIDLTTNKMIM